MERFLNEREVMNFLDIKKTTLRTLTLRKKVLTRYEIGNKYFYQTQEIMDYIEKCKARENDLKAFSEVQNIPSYPKGYARVITHQAFNLFQNINQLKFTWDCEKGMQILRLLASGKNYDTISKELYLSRERVRQLAERSIKKLGKKCLSMQDEYLNNYESVIEKNKQLVEENANLRQYIDSLPEEQQKKIQKMISKEDVFAKPIIDCAFDVRAYNTIASVGIKTLGELCRYSASELLRWRNLGKKSIVNIEEVMRDHGLVLGMFQR